MKIVGITCTYNRTTCLDRVVGFYLLQDHPDKHLLIYNSGKPTSLPVDLINRGDITLINNTIDSETRKSYESVGAKYNDALRAVPHDTHLVTSFDDDDLFLPNHLSEGVRGMRKAYNKDKLAYKPYYSYYRYSRNGEVKVEEASNVFEPSIFVDYKFIKSMGYANVNVRYHQRWLDQLERHQRILVDREGKPTFVYDWSQEIPVYKMSGTGDDSSKNFQAHATQSGDIGTGVINPWTPEQLQRYIDEVAAI